MQALASVSNHAVTAHSLLLVYKGNIHRTNHNTLNHNDSILKKMPTIFHFCLSFFLVSPLLILGYQSVGKCQICGYDNLIVMAIKSKELHENLKPVTCFKASSSKQHTFVSVLFCQHMTNVKSEVGVHPNM